MVAFPAAIDYGAAGPLSGPAALPAGARAPRFERLLGTDGHRYSLADFADKEVVVVVFSSNRCPTAKAHTDRLRDFQAEFGPRGVQLVLVNSNDPHLYGAERYERMVELSKEARYTFPYVADPDQQVARQFGATCTFHAFVLDRDRRVRYQGRFDDARVSANVTTTDVADAVEDVLAGRDVRVPETTPFGCSLDIVNHAVSHRSMGIAGMGLGVAIAAAWLLMAAAQITGLGAVLHHGALIENGPPLPLAAALSTAGFVVMTVGMMLPTSLRAVRTFVSDFSAGDGRAAVNLPLLGFITGYLAVWALFGVLCFAGDSVLHRLVDATPWLGEHSYLIAAAIFAIAGSYQLLPFKERCLASCRNPLIASHRDSASVAAGAAHGMDCVLSSGPLMLLMFAAGIANVGWMLALTALMVYETTGRHGRRVARAAGWLLIFVALLAVTTPGVAGLLAN